MKRFEFRLDAVLRLREVQLESEQVKLQQLLAEEQRLTAALEAIESERNGAKTFICKFDGLGSAELRAMSSFLLGMEARSGTLRTRVKEMSRPIQEQRESVLKAERNARLVVKLRERKMEEWKRESDREIETVAQESWQSARHVRRERVRGSQTSLHVAPAAPVRSRLLQRPD